MNFGLISIRMLWFEPALLLFGVATIFAFIAWRRRKERGLVLIAVGLALLVASISSLQLAYWLIQPPFFVSEQVAKLSYEVAVWLPIISGSCLAIGWWRFSREKAPNQPNQVPEPTAASGRGSP